MIEYIPPINKRSYEELIVIAYGSTDDWQQEAIDQAKAELKNRGITEQQQLQTLQEITEQNEYTLREEYKKRRTADYTSNELILMFLTWPKLLFRGWYLKKDGYELKAKRRWQIIGAGIAFLIVFILYAFLKKKTPTL